VPVPDAIILGAQDESGPGRQPENQKNEHGHPCNVLWWNPFRAPVKVQTNVHNICSDITQSCKKGQGSM
jgi:hypothetical protein